jgi:RNA polymerase sigma-70 factor (ECF subfamily)
VESDPKPTEPTERELVDRLRHGDASAFDEVHRRYHGRLFSFLVRLSGRRDLAEDLAQETWLKLVRMAPRLAEDSALAPLLFTIARNAFLSHRRWSMLDLSRIVTLGLELVAASASEPGPDVHLENSREIAELERALASLPLASRDVLLLVGVEGLEQEDVAKMLGISYAALRQRLSRARAQLTTAIEEQKGEEQTA